MDIFKSATELNNFVRQLKKDGKSLGLVPTMGALHEGHLSIIRRSISENDYTLTSIFVNPIQFNSPADLQAYPRPLEGDLALLRSIGCHGVFIPEVLEMYPQAPSVKFNFGTFEEVMEGKHRPGHFNGVAIVVGKLLNIINPDKIYFGLKDFQQLTIIKKLISDLSFPAQVVECETLRESDGLALSSRNIRIPKEKRSVAPELYRSLINASTSLSQLSTSEVLLNAKNYLANIADIKLEYFEIVDCETLMEVHHVRDHSKIALCLAAYIGEVRLIDNMIVPCKSL